MWVTAVLVVALVVLLLDVRYYHMWAYPLYIIGIVVMICVLIAGKEVNGAKSWIELGSLRIQPVEFVKIATALALAGIYCGNILHSIYTARRQAAAEQKEQTV